MTKYIFLIFAAIFLISFTAKAQKATIKKELDAHVKFLSETNTQVWNLSYELKDSEPFSVLQNDTTYHIDYFNPSLDLILFDKLYTSIPIRNSVLGASSTSLKKIKEQTKLGFEKIAERVKRLEIYYKTKKHEQDNFDEYHSILDSLFKLFDIHDELAYEYQTKLENIAQQKLVNTSRFKDIDKLVREHILEEKLLLKPFYFSYSPLLTRTNTSAFIEAVNKSYLHNEKLLMELREDKFSTYKSDSYILEKLISNLEHHQKEKKEIINSDDIETTDNDEYSNFALARLSIALDILTSDYSRLLEMGMEYGHYNSSVPLAFIPYKRAKSSSKFSAEFSYYKDIPYQICDCSSSSKSWTEKEFEAFSTYMYFLEEVKQGHKRFNVETIGYLNHPDSKYKIESISKMVSEKILPKESYLKVKLYSDALPKNCKESLLPQVENIYSISEELYSIHKRAYYSEMFGTTTQGAMKERFDKFGTTTDSLERMKERYFVLSDSLLSHHSKLREDITNSYYAKNVVSKESYWYKSVKQMQDLLLQQRKLALELHNRYLLDNDEIPRIDSLKKEYERYVGFNIDRKREPPRKEIEQSHYYYDYIEQTASEIIYGLSDKFYDEHSYYSLYKRSNYTFSSNFRLYENSINDYNGFLEKLPYRFLPDVSFIAISRRGVIEKEAITSKVEKTQETSKPIEVAEKKTKSNADSNKKSKEKSTVLRDTIYIYQKDTLYLDNSTVDEKFYNLDGYAPNNLVVLIDVSGSMQRADRLPLLKKSLKLFVANMRAEDEVSIVVYSGKAKVMLSPTSGNEKDKILKVIDELESEGKTNVEKGVKIAYKTANQNYKRKGNNKVILVTDGDFEVENSLLELVKENAENDIILSILNYSTQNAEDSLNKLIKVGGGYFRHITFSNADVMFMRETKVKK